MVEVSEDVKWLLTDCLSILEGAYSAYVPGSQSDEEWTMQKNGMITRLRGVLDSTVPVKAGD